MCVHICICIILRKEKRKRVINKKLMSSLHQNLLFLFHLVFGISNTTWYYAKYQVGTGRGGITLAYALALPTFSRFFQLI